MRRVQLIAQLILSETLMVLLVLELNVSVQLLV